MTRRAKLSTLIATLLITVGVMAWSLDAADGTSETPAQLAKRLTDENAAMRMQLKLLQSKLAEARGETNVIVTKMQKGIEANKKLVKTAEETGAKVKTLERETARLMGLLKTLSEKEPDEKLKKVLAELAGALDRANALQKDNTDLAKQLKDAKDSGEKSAKAVRALAAALKNQDTTISNLRQDLAIAKGRAIAPVTVPARPSTTKPTKPASVRPALTLTGVRVLAVRDNMASINAGKNRGIRAGMKLMILRDGKMVGMLEIIEATADSAAGVVTNSPKGIRAGDNVQFAQ